MKKPEPYLGLLKTTTVNFPGYLATAVFLPGCNLRCGYCYNAELACSDVNGTSLKSIENYATLSEVFAHLEKRRSVIQAIAISGGEPFLSPHLKKLLNKAKELDYKVKLDTNGLFPERLKSILTEYPKTVIMIALDIKTSPERYSELLPNKSDGALMKKKLYKTLNILEEAQNSTRLKVEYRTVLVPNLVGKSEIQKIGKCLPKNANWEFAAFLPKNCLNEKYNKIIPYTDAEISNLLNLAKTFVPKSELR